MMEMNLKNFSDAELEKVVGGEVVQLENDKWFVAGAFYSNDVVEALGGINNLPGNFKTKDGRLVACGLASDEWLYFESKEDAEKEQKSILDKIKQSKNLTFV